MEECVFTVLNEGVPGTQRLGVSLFQSCRPACHVAPSVMANLGRARAFSRSAIATLMNMRLKLSHAYIGPWVCAV